MAYKSNKKTLFNILNSFDKNVIINMKIDKSKSWTIDFYSKKINSAFLLLNQDHISTTKAFIANECAIKSIFVYFIFENNLVHDEELLNSFLKKIYDNYDNYKN